MIGHEFEFEGRTCACGVSLDDAMKLANKGRDSICATWLATMAGREKAEVRQLMADATGYPADSFVLPE